MEPLRSICVDMNGGSKRSAFVMTKTVLCGMPRCWKAADVPDFVAIKAVRGGIAQNGADDGPHDVEEAVTSSLEAWEGFSTGFIGTPLTGGAPCFVPAGVEIDPRFAAAYARLRTRMASGESTLPPRPQAKAYPQLRAAQHGRGAPLLSRCPTTCGWTGETRPAHGRSPEGLCEKLSSSSGSPLWR